MKNKYLILLWVCLWVGTTQAITIYTPDNLPKVHLQDHTRYVCDPEGILSTQTCQTIDQIFYRLEQQTGIETVVAVIPSIGEADCFDFSHELLNQWGVGKKNLNNGLVILLVTDQRCIQFYTGYGLEEFLPDAICKRIQMRYMIPYLKDNNWNTAMLTGAKAVYAQLKDCMNHDSSPREQSSDLTILWVILGFIIVGGGLFYTAVRHASKCPHCGKHELQRSTSRIIARRNGVKTEEVTYICRHCGHVVVRRKQSYEDNYWGGNGGGPIIFGNGGGFGGGSFGGGGFSGGSFGGGMGGGGGAGSRF